MTISTILFDFVGVLLLPDETHPIDGLARTINDRIGTVTNDGLFQAQIMAEFHLSEIEFRALLQSIVDSYTAFQPLWDLLPGLSKKYKLGIINNGTWLTYPSFNARFGIDRTFTIFLSSACEGFRKPDHHIYDRACELMKVLPAECLFMDDSEENVIGARQAGMQALWWKDPRTGFAQFLEVIGWMGPLPDHAAPGR